MAREAFRVLSGLGVSTYYDISIAGILEGPAIDLRLRSVDLVVVIGGDGTLLRLLQLLGSSTPLLYLIKYGRRAFLFDDVGLDEALAGIERVVNGRYNIDRYRRLRLRYRGMEMLALNEAAILALGSKTVSLRIQVGDEIVYRGMEGDGVIISTPIGSTAYNYSAGGPVIHPSLDAISITPVNSLGRSAGPLVVPGSATIRVLVEHTIRPVKLIVDGVVEKPLHKGSIIEASLNGAPVHIVRLSGERRIKTPWI